MTAPFPHDDRGDRDTLLRIARCREGDPSFALALILRDVGSTPRKAGTRAINNRSISQGA